MEDWPRLLTDFEPLPGVIKEDYDDFVVEELPLYAASGAGTHTYFLLEKRGLSTMQAVNDMARALGVRRIDIGYAGLKDARAVTRQWMSVEHVDPERIERIDLPRMRVLCVTRHANKLKLGHLRGNAFTIRIRHTDPGRRDEVARALETLAARGVPNYFGQQRFGLRGDTWEVGREIVRENLDAALDIVLGRPDPHDDSQIRQARELYEAGDYVRALDLWPHAFREERHALKTLLASRGRKKRAFLAIDRSLRRLYVSAYQSHLFNRIVAERLPAGLDRLMTGDLAERHRGGAVFHVLDAAVEQPRADAFEISPSGPLFGYRMTEPSGEPAAMEQRVLDAEGLQRQAFRSKHLRVKGGRRALRVPVEDARVALAADAQGNYLELRFTLPKGSYATSLLREVFHAPAPAEA